MKRDYESYQIVVHWDSDKCVHSGRCIRGLAAVFNKEKHPWIDLTGDTAEAVIGQVGHCPSGALSITKKHDV